MTVTVTPSVESGNWPPRIRLDISASGGETSTTVQRINGDGTTVPVRTYDGNPLPISGGVALLYDYEATFGDLVSFTTLESPGTISSAVSVAIGQVWLIHPGVPTLSMPIDLRPGTLIDETYEVRQGVFYPMGRMNPVVVTSGARQGATSTLVLMTQTDVDRQSLQALLSDTAPLLLNIPMSMNVGFDACYIAVGSVRFARWSDAVIDANRDVTLPFTVVDRPAGGSQAQRTWADILANYATWTDVQAAYPTWTALVAGP